MPYIDNHGQFTFECKPGEGILDSEHYTCKCPGCNAVVSGRTKHRRESVIAAENKWVLLTMMGGWTILYCSKQCAVAHAPALVDRHRMKLQEVHAATFRALDFWRP